MKATVSTKSVTKSDTITIPNEDETPVVESGTVKFKVSYPKEYKGKKHWTDGETIETSAESAKQFEELNLGKTVKE